MSKPPKPSATKPPATKPPATEPSTTRPISETIANAQDAKTWINFWVGQAEAVQKLVITKTGESYTGVRTMV